MIEVILGTIAVFAVSTIVIHFMKDVMVKAVRYYAEHVFGKKWGNRIAAFFNKVFTALSWFNTLIDVLGGLTECINEFGLKRNWYNDMKYQGYDFLDVTEMRDYSGENYYQWTAHNTAHIPKAVDELRSRRVLKYKESY